MKVCLDATALMCLLDTRLNEFPAPDGSIVGNMRRRMDHLIASIDQVNRHRRPRCREDSGAGRDRSDVRLGT